ncbi:MAG: hypothetical protein JNK57_17200 [Planctomycetaceae bacterium]|nr:hypothetical protein [Planctomycetaceae bacterium]
MSIFRFTIAATLTSFFGLCLTATTHAQSYFDLMSGVINEGQAAEAQIWQAFNHSLQAEQNVYQQAMQDPQVQARYRQFLANGGQASLGEYAAYYVRSAGGDPQAFRRNMRRQSDLNARDRNAIFENYAEIHRINQNTHLNRERSMDYRHRQIGEELLGTATHHNQWGSFQVPTTLTYGNWAADDHGNMFTVDRSGQYYLYTNWGWQPLQSSGR